jgi:hypothetical protein
VPNIERFDGDYNTSLWANIRRELVKVRDATCVLLCMHIVVDDWKQEVVRRKGSLNQVGPVRWGHAEAARYGSGSRVRFLSSLLPLSTREHREAMGRSFVQISSYIPK